MLSQVHLELALHHVGVSINAAVIHHEREEAMGTLQQQTEALQHQQEELRATNEELEEQAEALKASRSELQSQQEELQVINEELEEQKEALVGSKLELEQKNDEVEEKAHQVEEASRYKSEFLANMSHELRTPLNSLLIFARMLSDNKEGNLSERQVDFASTIHEAGTDLLHLINDILDLSKVEAGQLEVALLDVPIQDLIDHLRDTIQAMAMEKGLEFVTSIEPGLPESICTDTLRFEQVLKNFLSNAVKFTEQGCVELRVSRPGPALSFPGGPGTRPGHRLCRER